MRGISDDVVLVLLGVRLRPADQKRDDWKLLDQDPPINQWIEKILEQLKHVIHGTDMAEIRSRENSHVRCGFIHDCEQSLPCGASPGERYEALHARCSRFEQLHPDQKSRTIRANQVSIAEVAAIALP